MQRSLIGLFSVVVVSGLPACVVEDDDGVAGVDESTADSAKLAPVSLVNCTYTLVRDSITVVKGEGGFDPGLELDVDTTALTSTVNFNGTIKNGASHNTDEAIDTVTVPAGTVVTIAWDVDATEFDTLDADDHGTGGGSLSFTCTGSGVKTDSDQVSLGNAIIAVQVKATW